MEELMAFVAALKAKLRSGQKQDQEFLIKETNSYANGSTEHGFWGDTVVDMDELDRKIDEFCAEFQAKSKGE